MRSSRLLLVLPVLLAMGLLEPIRAQQAYTLDDLLRLGREKNPRLLSVQAQWRAAVADRRDAGRFQNPELEYGAGEGEPFETSETKSLREVSVRQAIENPLSRHYRLGTLDEGVGAAEEEVRLGSLEVDCEIRLHFYRILFLQELVELKRLNEEALWEVRGLIEARARVGEVKELESIRLRVEHLRALNDLNAATMELEQFRRQLDMFLGEVLPPGYELAGTMDADPVVPDFEDLAQSLLPQHPLLRQAALRRAAADRRLQASRFAWVPNPVLSATSARELDGDILTFGIGFEIPLWNQSRAAVERDRETLRDTEHQEESLRLELQAQLMVHHNHLLLHRQTVELYREGLLEEAELSMGIAETSYREGEISLVDYLDARRTFQSFQIEYQQALYDWNREMAELDRAAGGGVL